MRQGELFALTPADLRLDDKNPHLLVDWTLTEGEEGELVRTAPKTKASRRRVDLDPETVAIPKAKIEGLDPSEHVFTTKNGSLLRKSLFLRRVWQPLLETAELPKVTFHSLRHVANTLLLASGKASHLDLAKRLGHSTPRMKLERYARVVPGAQASLAVEAGALFGTGSGAKSKRARKVG
jgi:integrase